MLISNEDYQSFRPLLFSLGYRMLGSVSETEDLVQETFLQAYQVDEHKVQNKKAYLCKMMTNNCLDLLKSARVKREQYVGPWLPEPLLLGEIDDNNPFTSLLQKEGLSMAYLTLMENLTPHERAVFLLREVFHFDYHEVADFVGKKEDNCRKLFSRAKQKLSSADEESLSFRENLALINQFIQAFQTQDMGKLLELVSDKITLFSDGGGKVKAAIRPITTQKNVLAFLFGINQKMPLNFYFELKNINGQPGLVNYVDGNIHSTITFNISEEKVQKVFITMNPEKLKDKVAFLNQEE